MENENIVTENETENMQDFSSDTIQSETSVETETFAETEYNENDSTETEIDDSETVSESSGDDNEEDTTDYLDEDMSIPTPEDEENETSVDTVSGNSLESSSEGSSSGSINYESFDYINEALTLIKSENAAYYKDSLYVQENVHRELQHISFLTECLLALSAVIGFFVVMHTGGKLVSYFFERMR